MTDEQNPKAVEEVEDVDLELDQDQAEEVVGGSDGNGGLIANRGYADGNGGLIAN